MKVALKYLISCPCCVRNNSPADGVYDVSFGNDNTAECPNHGMFKVTKRMKERAQKSALRSRRKLKSR